MIEWIQSDTLPDTIDDIVVAIEDKTTGDVEYGIGRYDASLSRPWIIVLGDSAVATFPAWDDDTEFYRILGWSYLDNRLGGRQ